VRTVGCFTDGHGRARWRCVCGLSGGAGSGVRLPCARGQGKVLGRGFNQVVELRDPSAHAEIMALRAAGGALGRHVLEDCVLYSSSEPCPMCLAACYWASVPRVVFAATSRDLAGYHFQDLAFYTQLGLPAGRRSMREDADREELRQDALLAVQEWAQHR
jgi:guanine deaminase